MQLHPWTYLQGDKYRIIRCLGNGGFGITYLAEHELAGRNVCIKEFFPKEFYNRDENSRSISLGSKGSAEIMDAYKQKFMKEAKTIARLNHPNIIHIFDVFAENNTAYYVMEYIDGESLSDVVKRRGALPEAEAVKYIRQIATALGYIHDRNIMHLDIKPANVMLNSEDGQVILIDFGLSKQYDAEGNQTSSTPVGISAGYAPMEQYQRGGVKEFSPETDIYSLGATLYYLVTGIVPPQAATIADDGLPELPSHLSSGVRNAIERSMEISRKRRPHSIKEFMALLDGNNESTVVRDDEVVVIPEPQPVAPQPVAHVAEPAPVSPKPKPEPMPKPKPKPKRKRRWLWLLVVTVVILIGAYILVNWAHDGSAPEDEFAWLDECAMDELVNEGIDYIDYEDYDKAAECFRTAAENGHAYGQYALGLCYDEGLGVPQDSEKAVKWWSRAAAQGEPEAMVQLGIAYYFGSGVEYEDYEEAVKWFRAAARKGNADGQYLLGLCYFYGEGVDQDYDEALLWLEKAVDQGHEDAIEFIEELEAELDGETDIDLEGELGEIMLSAFLESL